MLDLVLIKLSVMFFGKNGLNLTLKFRMVTDKKDFFYFNLLVSNVYFGSTKLPQINRIIVYMFNDILTVAVNM